jgi:hypothetical protein
MSKRQRVECSCRFRTPDTPVEKFRSNEWLQSSRWEPLGGIRCSSAETTWNVYWALLWFAWPDNNAEQEILKSVENTENMSNMDDIV